MTARLVPVLGVLASCGAPSIGDGASATGTRGDSTGVGTAASDRTADTAATIGDGSEKLDIGGGSWPPPSDPDLVDVLVVIENTAEMAAMQARFAQTAMSLVRRLHAVPDSCMTPRVMDAQIMFTTTDAGHALCDPPRGYSPAFGAPTVAGCNARIEEFGEAPTICTALCPTDVVPSDPFIAFSDTTTNIERRRWVDVDGDGELDSPAAQAAACLAPVGLRGCAYASPLEAMRRALDPDAAWNQGTRPFLRPDAALLIVTVGDGLDCSLADPSVGENPRFMEAHPDTGEPTPSLASCWNAGVVCDRPDADGVHGSCAPAGADTLVQTSSYAEFLAELGAAKNVFMAPFSGVPAVTAHAAESPYLPEEGGVASLVYRTVADARYPEGDLLPSDIEAGLTAAHKQFEHGIGPGCAGEGADGLLFQATPDPRTISVCQSLNVKDDENGGGRCCVESICDPDQGSDALCMLGMLAATSFVTCR